MSNRYDKILGKYRVRDAILGSPWTSSEIPFVSGVDTLATVGSGGNDKFAWNGGNGRTELVYQVQRSGYSASSWNGDDMSPEFYGTTAWNSNGIEITTGTLAWDIVRDASRLGGILTTTFEWENSMWVASDHAFGAGDFTVLELGNDSLAAFNSTPFRLWWDDSNGYLTWDDGGSGLIYLRANLSADYLTGIISNLGTITGTSAALTPTANTTTVPLTVRGASATSNVGVTFTYAAAQTFTVTIASPGVLTTAAPHGLSANHMVRLSTTGALPTGLGTTTLYYVRNPSGSTLELSLTSGGASINTSGTQSGTHTITPLCKCTATSHGRAANDPIIFAGGSPLPTGITAGSTYLVGAGGLTTNEFYPKINTSAGVAQYVAITSSGSGAPFVYGQNADIGQWQNSANVVHMKLDKYGALWGSQITTPWRIGHIPEDINFSGIWFAASAVSPSASNYAFLGDASNTFINGPSYVYFRTGNTNRVQISSSGLLIYDAHNIALQTTTGTKIGTATNEKLAFHNSTPVIQRAGAAQAAVATTASTNASPYGYTTAAQADAIVTLVNEIRATLVEKGLMKGAA